VTDSLEPQQQRSRETLARLLAATIGMLEEHGLSGATIPRIADAAGVAPASVYRRFRNKDALYRAAFLQALESSAQAARKTMRIESFKDRTLEGVAGELVSTVLKQYRVSPGVIRALLRFVEDDTDKAFKKRMLTLISGNFERLIEVLLTFRAQIGHRNPRRAVTFALLSMVTAVEVRMLEDVSLWRELLPISDKELHRELTRSLLAYLQSRDPKEAAD
jgi:AcrR family transcriptional regulator